MKLNLGCGPDVRRGYVNMDIRELPGVVEGDVSDPIFMFSFREAEEILAYDILEHFDRKTARECLKLWIDTLASGGIIRIRCPEIRHACSLPQPDEWFELLMYGGQDYPENTHKCGFTRRMLLELLEGMEILRVQLTPAGNIEIDAQKP